ncbi:DCN1-like protein 3 [Alosa sapidissima]|uniref:DCN1-like protein 3 n=1 Tax=Alosa sapidissima TaxID=34773 RepID=UPI001C08B27D|nr:DCN1-like protein 3 [Alosa sapidissima]XP_041938420.1 DCN1-like protein 3 [Alosa sapidissima]XP_041938421.1 DCN1-like protein 3 [Alosa sapidissima]XP_041938422.1 DCN1-like protein 3 [Alosa sapidissima]XP_041938423.1 DCN1-like protein 3 [Alosa sapidissima]
MGQCVTKCKNPTSSLGSKSGDKEKSHGKKGGGGGGGGGHKEDPCPKSSAEPVYNGTKAPDVTVETSVAPPPVHGEGVKEEGWAEGDGVSLRRIEEMFLRYKDEQEDAILEEGMECFCEDLHVDPAEFRVLVLAWKFQAATMCKFTRKEFVEGCRAIQADSVEGICSRFSVLMEEARGEESFKDLYRFTFQFGLDVDEGQRSLQRGIAVALWRLVFTQDMPPVLEHWLDFLSENPCGVRGISRDTWNMFLNFTQSIGPDLSNYSEDEAWPSLFDSFVEWETERRRREQEAEDERWRGMGGGGGGEEEGGECPPPSVTDCSDGAAAQGWTSH